MKEFKNQQWSIIFNQKKYCSKSMIKSTKGTKYW